MREKALQVGFTLFLESIPASKSSHHMIEISSSSHLLSTSFRVVFAADGARTTRREVAGEELLMGATRRAG